MVAMIVNDSSGTSSIFVRSLDALAPRELPGTKGAYLMFWSPDSRYLAFFANETALWKVAVAGGEPERICATKSARGGSWGRDGTILLAPFSNGGIFRVSANGGDPVQITHPDSAHGETGHRFPQWLPDGKHFLYAAVPGGADGKGSGYVASVDGGAPKLAGRGESGPCFDPSGWLFTTRGTRITAYPFDGSGIATNRDGITLGDVAIETQFSGGSTMTTSREGSMAYLKDVRAKQRLVWCGSDGRIASTVPVPPGNHLRVWLSPEGRRALLFTISDEGAQQLLLVDLERGTMTRVSGDGEIPSTACWSPDGQRIAYEDEATGSVLIKSLADGGVRRVLGSDRTFKQVYAWSMDGKMIVYARLDSRTRWDIWGVAADGDTVPKPLVRTPANDQFAALSPDGRWIAYMSDATGRLELFVAAPAAESVPQQVSTESAIGVAWLFGGKELWWVQPSTPPVVWKAAVVPGSSFSVGSVRPVTALPDGTVWSAPDPEGSRALAIVPAGERAQQTIVVLQGWPAALHKN
jgi:Tol biopolymer transport system component